MNLDYQENMTHSKWICNTCEEEFQTRGKRDGHNQRVHRQKIIIDVENQEMTCYENGKFICKCGRNYMWPRSLQRHQRNCNVEISFKEIDNNVINDDIDLFQPRLC